MKGTGIALLVVAIVLGLGGVGCGNAPEEAVGVTTTAAPSAAQNDGPSQQAPEGTRADPATGASGSADSTGGVAVTYSSAYTVSYDDEDLDDGWSTASASFITLTDGSIRFDGAGATVAGGKVTISAAGTYVVSGTLADGQIVVDLKEKGMVKLVLNGADIACSTSAPIYVKNAYKTVIVLADNTVNIVRDGDSYALKDPDADEPDAAIFSKDDLTINGSGSLTVKARYDHGIVSKDDLKIVSGSITVTAVNDGLKGRDSIGIKGGEVTVEAGGDGLQANNDVDAGKGYIDIRGGTLDITAGADGLQAETTILVGAGDLSLSTGGGSTGSGNLGGVTGRGGGSTGGAGPTSTSAKGLKAGGGVFVAGGTITVDSRDDSVHSNGSIKVDGGTMTLASGDDAMHADATVEINNGDLTITKSYEGIESAVVTINGGVIRIKASDDGVNVVEAGGASSPGGRWGPGAFTVNENNKFYINGGYLAVDADGDGIDCNGRMFMTAGTVLINGPTNDGNGALDYLGEFTVSGGYLVAVGSSGMAEAPSESSTQYSLMINFDTVQAAGTLIHVQDENGDSILTFAPTKQYRSVVLSSPDIKEGAAYTVYVGGSQTGSAVDSLYADGVYTPGEKYATLTVSGIVTIHGSFGGIMGGGGMWPGGGTPPGGGTFPGGGTRPGGRGGSAPDGGAFPGTPPGDAIPGTPSTTVLSF